MNPTTYVTLLEFGDGGEEELEDVTDTAADDGDESDDADDTPPWKRFAKKDKGDDDE